MKFGTSKKKKDYTYYWTMTGLANFLSIRTSTLRLFLQKKDLLDKLSWDKRGRIIPQDIADRILGLKSKPPDQVDEVEYSHTPIWLARRMDITKKTLRKRIKKLDLRQYLIWDKRGSRIPRSICQLIYPYLKLGP